MLCLGRGYHQKNLSRPPPRPPFFAQCTRNLTLCIIINHFLLHNLSKIFSSATKKQKKTCELKKYNYGIDPILEFVYFVSLDDSARFFFWVLTAVGHTKTNLSSGVIYCVSVYMIHTSSHHDKAR